MWTVDQYVAWALTTLVSAFVGSYLGGYLKKKGENLASKEDVDGLVKQMSAVTEATKKIEAEISSDVWDRQKRWELKREVLFESLKNVAAAVEAVKTLNSLSQTERSAGFVKSTDWTQIHTDETQKYFVAKANLDESRLFVGATCGPDVADAVNTFSAFISRLASKIVEGDAAAFGTSAAELVEVRNSVRNAIRKELAIEATKPQSNESSAAPIPAPRAR